MAAGYFEFYSDCLKRRVAFRIFLPNEGEVSREGKTEPMKLLLLLHGYSEGGSEWMWYGNAASVADQYHLCIVLPAGENSFYLDGSATGRRYAAYVGEELPRYVRRTFGLSDRREDTFIGGSSMGGFGALHTALQFADTFGGAIALSSALIMHEVAGMKQGQGNGVANYDYYRLMFGETESVEESQANPEKLLTDRLRQGGSIPRLYLACGEQDFLLQHNRSFVEFLSGHPVEFEYREGTGGHDFRYWSPQLEQGIRWLLECV